MKEGGLGATWVPEGDATQIALAGNRIGIIDNDHSYVKEGGLGATWIPEGDATQIALPK